MKEMAIQIRECFKKNFPYDGPFIVLDAEAIRNRALSFRKSFSLFPDVRFLYSYKTNSTKAVCGLLKDLGYGAEVVSGYELRAAIEDGQPQSNIFFDGPLKTASELDMAIKNQVVIQLDSLDEWQLLKRIAAGNLHNLKIGVRFAHHYENGALSRFGFNSGDFNVLINEVQEVGVEITGAHLHVGSNILHVDPYLIEIDRYFSQIQSIVRNSKKNKPWIDLGGGFPALSNREGMPIPDLSQWALRILSHFISKGLDVSKFQLVLEPGRHLVEDAGLLFCQSYSFKKRSPTEQILMLDAGLNLARSFHGWRHKLFSLDMNDSSATIKAKVYGPNCYEGDLFYPEFEVSDAIKAGDWFCISNVGGYDIPSINSWTRPHPPIFLWEDGKLKETRQRSSHIETRLNAI